MLPAHDVDCFEFAALDTLQHRLPRNPKRAHGFPHGHEAVRGLTVEPGREVVGQADAPWGTRRRLFSRDDSVVEQAMDGGRCDTENDSGLPDGHQFGV